MYNRDRLFPTGVPVHMIHQASPHAERSPANLAPVWLLTSVCPPVPIQVNLLCKHTGAHVTAVRLLPRVGAHVALQAPVAVGAVRTELARPGLSLIPRADESCPTLKNTASTCNITVTEVTTEIARALCPIFPVLQTLDGHIRHLAELAEIRAWSFTQAVVMDFERYIMRWR